MQHKQATTDSFPWRHSEMRGTLWCILSLLGGDLLSTFIRSATGSLPAFWTVVLPYAVYPFLVRLLIFVVMFLLIWWIQRRNIETSPLFVYSTCVSIMLLSVAWVYRAYPVSCAVFLLPLLITLMYPNKRLRHYVFWLNLGLFLGYVVLLNLLAPVYAPMTGSVVLMLALLGFSDWVGQMVLNHQNKLIDEAAHANLQSKKDSLTQLYNHAAFYEQLDEHIIRNASSGEPFCLIIFDIDDFKRVNDTFGHDVGDTVLLKLVDAINASIVGTDVAFRYGGEEFTVLTTRGANDSLMLAEAVRASFAARLQTLSPAVEGTVSAGVCQFNASRFSGRREFFASADDALYEAKRTGKDKAVLWTPKLLERP